MKPSAIRVGNRHRQSVGDVRSLAASIDRVGLLHPIVVDGNGRLVAGARRLAAVRLLGWRDVPVRVVQSLSDALSALVAERDENAERKAFLPSEMVAIARALEPLERAEARRRQTAHLKRGTRSSRSGQLPEREAGQSRDKLASAVGVSARTLDKAKAVVEAAERNPKLYRRLLEQMDRSCNVHGAFRQLERHQQAESIAASPPPFPRGRYGCIVADVPWRFNVRPNDLSKMGRCPYPDMSVEDICALPVPRLAEKDCVLWLWTTNAHMRESFDVLKAWGFESKTILTWAKPRIGNGTWLRGQTEHCHLAVRGKPTVFLTNQSTLLTAPRGSHSEKPDAFYRMIAEMCPGSRVELFARRARPGFVVHGNVVAVRAAAG
jgi:N6-adenosine-specific RNA methylase IME4